MSDPARVVRHRRAHPSGARLRRRARRYPDRSGRRRTPRHLRGPAELAPRGGAPSPRQRCPCRTPAHRLGADRVRPAGPRPGPAQAVIPSDDDASLRVATRAGLRREGVSRISPGTAERETTTGYVVAARLASDPPLSDPSTFRSLLNSFLPRKRAIGQMLVRDPEGRVLLGSEEGRVGKGGVVTVRIRW